MAAVAILNLWFKNHLNIWNCLPTAVILSHNVGLSTFKRHLAKFNFSTFFHYTQLFLLLYVCLFQLLFLWRCQWLIYHFVNKTDWLIDWTSCFNFVVFDCLVWHIKTFAQTLLHTVKQRKNGCGGKILYRWCPNSVPHLPVKNYKCSFKFAKIIVKKSTGLFFVDLVYIFGF